MHTTAPVEMMDDRNGVSDASRVDNAALSLDKNECYSSCAQFHGSRDRYSLSRKQSSSKGTTLVVQIDPEDNNCPLTGSQFPLL